MPTPHTTPASPALSELMEEFRDTFLKEYPNDQSTRLVRGYWVSDYTDFLAKTFAAGVKAGLMEAKEILHEEETLVDVLARLDDKINSLK